MSLGEDRTEVVAKSVVRYCNQSPKLVNFHYTGGLVINGEKIPFFDITSLDIHRDFIGNFSDIITVNVLMDTRKYYTTVLDNLEQLEGWLSIKQMAENSMLLVKGGYAETKQFKVIAYNPPTRGLGAGANGSQEITDPDQTVTSATFQFIYKDAYEIRQRTFAGMMQQTIPAQALQMILDGCGEDYGFAGVHRAEWDVNTPRQIIIPQGTHIKDMAQYIQNEYGIYNTGIGCYIFDQPGEYAGIYWWLYPLFNNQRYTKEFYKATIFVVPQKYAREDVPRTYEVDNGNITMYITSETSMMQNKAADQINQGTGIQVMNPSENTATTATDAGPNKRILDGSTGVSTYNVVDRKDGMKNYVNVYEDTTNMAKLISSVVGNQGTYLTLTWKHANPYLLQPGMPVKVSYLDGHVKTLYGTLHEYHAILVKRSNIAVVEQSYTCNVVMKIYVTEE